MSNREHLRIEQQISIVIDYFVKDNDSNTYKPRLLICEGLDVSSGGLKIHVDRELPLQAIYQVALKTQTKEFRLAIQTKWLKSIDDKLPEYAIGLQILESDETDIVAWKEWVAEQLDIDDVDLPI